MENRLDTNSSGTEARLDDTVDRILAAVASRHPDRCAIIDGDDRVSYRTLAASAGRIAAALAEASINPGDIVALTLERSAEAITAMLGILAAGAGYLPLDASHPPARLSAALADANVRFIISHRADRELMPGSTAHQLAFEDLVLHPGESIVAEHGGGSPAYVMFTSGSTGGPKGVVVPHRAVIRLVCGVDYIDFGEAPRVLHAAPLGFDASTFEIWGALLNGGTIVVHRDRVTDGRALAAAISRHDVDIAWLTAALFNAIVDDDPRHLAGLKTLLTGGEALSVRHVRKVLAALPDTVLVNGYGPTETTTFAATYRIPRNLPPGIRSVPIGKAIARTTLHILDASGQPVADGAIGELHIGGDGVAIGYVGKPGLTAERFVPDPFAGGTARMYRSGDDVRRLPDGNLEFIGRRDGQVKLRGFRIETGEVESALKELPDVTDAAVLVRDDHGRGSRLVAYVVGKRAFVPDALRAALHEALPDFMVPSIVVPLPALPVTANGKLDRAALPAPLSGRPHLSVPFAEPNGRLERRVASVFAHLLGLDRVGRDDGFFELGGHSLLAVRAVAALAGDGAVPTIADFFRAPTVAALARVLEQGAAPQPRPARSDGTEPTEDSRKIAIIAMAGRFPGASDVEAFWRNLREGRESITRFDADQLDPSIPAEVRRDPDYVPSRGVLDDAAGFDAPFFGMTAREAELTDPQQRVFLELCWECLERAGHAPGSGGGPVGVFAGMHNATYFRNHVSTHPDAVARFGEFQVMLANEKDYLATRVAHRLDLTGPAVSVNTACSTSLVAICEAIDALRANRCRMALAGGVSITCPPASGYLRQDGAMLSPDGATRTFSADAAGTVFSDGAAVVLLKRLDDALADGDPVIAVILGAAVNNDGAGRASFTAPSSDGQSAVIAMALDDAGVDARSISYVEAHGTATPLGDPIEIDGLTRAFRRSTDATGYCAIGSLKSNVGHLVTAAGAAGVIKTALALAERTLPPTLHAGEALNPHIDFPRSPFVVNRMRRDWPAGNGPRRAGVSAFGVGGTNAHVILEEAPSRTPSEPSAGPHLLVLSARTPAALAAASSRLQSRLENGAPVDLGDVAFTLARGRKAFEHRAFVVAEDATDAVARLGASLRTNTPSANEVVFMFPGQGAQYPGMGRVLYATEPAFRTAIDACAEALAGELGSDLRERLFTADGAPSDETAFTQPAIFAVEYALALLWMDAGLRPAALVGHSVGEFVAAAVSGVMELHDAAVLVARRGRLMQAQPAGAMLSVRLPAGRLLARLPASLALAAENAPDACVVSGDIADVETLRIALTADGIACRPLAATRAFHSSMMDPVLAPFGAEVAGATLSPPSIPIVSTRTGAVLKDAEATSCDYWTRHLRESVHFSQAIATVLATPGSTLVETGPRSTLAGLARRQPAARGRTIVASLGDSVDRERGALLTAAGELWCAGLPLDPARFDHRANRRRICLPTYAFEHERYWLDALPASGIKDERASPLAAPSTAPMMPAADPRAALVATVTPPSDSPSMAAAPTTPAPVAAAASRLPTLIERLIAVFEDVSGQDFGNVDPAAAFVEIGLDSLSLTQVALQVSKAFGVKITFRQLMEDLASFGELAMHIDQHLPPDAAPATATVPATPAGAQGPLLQQVIQQQMDIMRQQLALLSQPAALSTASMTAPSPPAAMALAAAPIATDTAEARAPQRYDVAKAFGAIARIHSHTIELTDRQQARLDAFMRRYGERTARSKAYAAAHRPHLADPRVVNGFRPMLKEIVYPIVIERSRGSRLFDLDGNEYVDALNGFGMNLFGWQPDFVRDALHRQLDLGFEIGPQHPLAGEVAELICGITGSERAALCNTGSEAVLGTIRIARTVTGREKLVMFAGSYHGINDEVIVRAGKNLRSVPAAPGILANTSEHVLVLDYGSPESLEVIRAHADDIAAVLVEPVQSRRPDLQPREFLHELRKITRAAGTCLVFDEVVTGFRSHPRGAQHLFGVDADLACYGKVVGGGLPIGVIAGRHEWMDALDGGQWRFGDDSHPTVGVTYFAGTFVRHPLALAAAKAVLEHLRNAGPELQERLTAGTAQMAAEMNRTAARTGAPVAIRQFASVWKLVFTEDHPLQDLLFAMMRNRGIHILDNFPCFMTTAHSDADRAAIARAFAESIAEMQEAGFLPRRQDTTRNAFDASQPPIAGARLGRDPDGRPAWYIPDAQSPGKFVKVDA
ncbi:MAG: amino acid adenylation domain-containing protein [Lysobacterales bacterium]